ncbi:major capsid protein P2 [Idiomarina seosinensis]|uniref:major capsid protein P2 n=1 Tax=Idiomarina seosinensis TaxID=281739 RepID=UPI00384D1ED2
MSRKLKQLPSLSNVAAGSTATLELPLGHTYDRVTLEYAGVTPAQMKNIQVVINGKVIWQLKTAERLNQLNAYYNRAVNAGFLDFHFVRPEFDNIDFRRLFAIGTADVATFSIKFDIDAAASAPVVTAHAVQSLNSPLGLITKIKEFPTSTATSGAKEIDSLPKQARIGAIHLFGKADISRAEVEVDSYKQYEASKALGEKLQSDIGRTPLDANGTTIDFVREGNPMNALVLRAGKVSVQDFRLRLTCDTPGSWDTVCEYYDQFQGI